MNAPARLQVKDDPLDVIAVAIARALARQHHAAALADSPDKTACPIPNALHRCE